jgi:hypothetical protein
MTVEGFRKTLEYMKEHNQVDAIRSAELNLQAKVDERGKVIAPIDEARLKVFNEVFKEKEKIKKSK